MPHPPLKLAAVQAAPVFMDGPATVDKACALIAQAAEAGADLVLFPEAFVPGYPLWVWFVPPGDTATLRQGYTRLVRNSVTIPGPLTERLGEASRECGVTVAIPVSELATEGSGTTVYNTILYFGPDGRILGKHRKLVPTVGERMLWGQGDGSTLEVFDTPVGRLGGLVCWENYMPLARYAMYAQGVQIYLAPTWDRGEPWVSTMRHIAKEGRVIVVSACSAMRREHIPEDLDFKERYLPADMEWINPGMSCMVDPDGKFLVEPVEHRETILYCDVDPDTLLGPRFQLDVAGHYARPDVFDLTIDRRAHPLTRSLTTAQMTVNGGDADPIIESLAVSTETVQ